MVLQNIAFQRDGIFCNNPFHSVDIALDIFFYNDKRNPENNLQNIFLVFHLELSLWNESVMDFPVIKQSVHLQCIPKIVYIIYALLCFPHGLLPLLFLSVISISLIFFFTGISALIRLPQCQCNSSEGCG